MHSYWEMNRNKVKLFCCIICSNWQISQNSPIIFRIVIDSDLIFSLLETKRLHNLVGYDYCDILITPCHHGLIG